MSGVFTAGIFLPGLIILANLLSGVFTAAGITEPPANVYGLQCLSSSDKTKVKLIFKTADTHFQFISYYLALEF